MKNTLIPFLIFLLAACSSGKKDYTDAMMEQHKNDAPVQNMQWDEPSSPVSTMSVAYTSLDGKEIMGYLAEPKQADENTPGLLIIHEWWGLNDNIRMMARRFAGEGYRVLAVDLYGGKVAETSEDAMTFMRGAMSDMETGRNNMKDAYTYLTQTKNSSKVGVVGWCFGGAWSLQTSLALPTKIDASAIYYGRLITDASALETLQMPIIGFFGGEDKGIPVEGVKRFETVLDSLNKDAEIIIYDGAGHAFANPSGRNYQEKPAVDSWNKTIAFFNEHLK